MAVDLAGTGAKLRFLTGIPAWYKVSQCGPGESEILLTGRPGRGQNNRHQLRMYFHIPE